MNDSSFPDGFFADDGTDLLIPCFRAGKKANRPVFPSRRSPGSGFHKYCILTAILVHGLSVKQKECSLCFGRRCGRDAGDPAARFAAAGKTKTRGFRPASGRVIGEQPEAEQERLPRMRRRPIPTLDPRFLCRLFGQKERDMIMHTRKLFFILLAGLFLILSCQRADAPPARDARLTVIATIFPLCDFAREVGGDKASVTMLLPPASDAHHYELKPDDIVRVSHADIFLFVSFEMEQWAYKVINAAAEKTNMLAVEAGKGAMLLPLTQEPGHGHESDAMEASGDREEEPATRYDPHIWLDFANAQTMIDNIAAAFINKDPSNSETYKQNAERYKARLQELDRSYRTGLSDCRTRTLLHAGHWAFSYLARRYQLTYLSAYNMSADAEPSPQQMLMLINEVKKKKLPYIYYEDLAAPKLAKTIAAETGVGLLKLNNGHDVGKRDIQAGATFISLMEGNLKSLKKGMQCP